MSIIASCYYDNCRIIFSERSNSFDEDTDVEVVVNNYFSSSKPLSG